MLGGSYWLFSLAASHASVFVAVHVYNQGFEDSDAKIEAATLWKGSIALAVSWGAAFAYFALRVSVPKFRHTLWSTRSGRSVAQDKFLLAAEDEKIGVFFLNQLLWEDELGAQVMEWTLANWAELEREQALIFVLAKPMVPDKYIPPQFLAEMGGANRERRGSAALSIRQSLRRGSFAEEMYA
jgi:hypothetical protein